MTSRASPSQLSEDVGPDHVGRPRDHLQRAGRLLERALDHVAAGVFGADGLGQPALALVEDVPLVALDRGHLRTQLRPRLGLALPIDAVATTIPVSPEEMGQVGLDRVGERNDVGIPHDYELCLRVSVLKGDLQRSTLEPFAVGPVHDLEARPVLPGLQDLGRLVSRIVHYDNFVVLVLEGGAALEETRNDPPLVVSRYMNGHERLVTQGHVSVSIAIAVAIAVPTPEKSHDAARMRMAGSIPTPFAVPLPFPSTNEELSIATVAR